MPRTKTEPKTNEELTKEINKLKKQLNNLCDVLESLVNNNQTAYNQIVDLNYRVKDLERSKK